MDLQNLGAATLILARDDVDARLKDHEGALHNSGISVVFDASSHTLFTGLSPFDVFNSTVEGTNPSFSASSSNPGRLDLFSWGSNRNFVLGFQSDSDRVHPERVQLKREEGGTGLAAFEPLRVKEVQMARLHTGIVTDEKRGNVRLCGYGTGGR